MGEIVRWGIWGSGSIAYQLASDFPFVKGARLAAVASRNLDHSKRFASTFGVTKSYAGLAALLNDSEVDAVYVATPNHLHMDDAVACLEAGKAVLCEKPFALNQAQAQRMADTARRHKVFCMEAMWTRFIPAVAEAKRAIAAGAIGRVRGIQGNFAYPVAAGFDSRFFNAQEGGGALLDRGVYLISLAQFLFGHAISIGGMATLAPTGVDEQSSYQLKYEGGILADFNASLRTRGTNEVMIAGEGGTLRLCEPFYRSHRLVTQTFSTPGKQTAPSRSQGMQSLRRRLSPLLNVLRGGRAQSFIFPGNGYQFELQHVTGCIGEGRTESAIMPLDDSVEVMRVIDVLQSQMREV